MTDDPDPQIDDWEQHWSDFAEVARDNPAQAYRVELILGRLAEGGPPRRVLDIGSGPGDLLAAVADRWPSAELAGIELSQEGIRHASAQVPTARFHRRDLLGPEPPPDDLVGWADVAVCSEVLEHVDEPARFLQVATELLAPGGRLIITVPGGPRTAFDRHIGHRRHYRRSSLRELLAQTDLAVDDVAGAGFPFFDLYKLVVLLQGERLAADVADASGPSFLARTAMRTFGLVLRPRRNSRRFGWQMVASTRRPA